MFGNLFKPKIEHPDPLVRINAIKVLHNSKDVQILAELALNDADERVRVQALTMLISSISSQTSLKSDLASQLFSITDDSNLKETLLLKISHVDDAIPLVDKIEDQVTLRLIATKSPVPNARKRAAEKIIELGDLKYLLQNSSDKNVLQIIRQKVQIIKSHNKEKQAAFETLNQICTVVERLAKSDLDSMAQNRLHNVESHWKDQDDKYKTDFIQRYQQAISRCHEIIKLEKENVAAQEFELAQNDLCQSFCQSFEGDISAINEGSYSLWGAKHEVFNSQWKTLCQHHVPAADVNERFQILNNAAQKANEFIRLYTQYVELNETQDIKNSTYESLDNDEKTLYQLVKNLNWPYQNNAPMLYQHVRGLHSQSRQILKEKQKVIREQRGEIAKKIAILKSHIRQKNLIKANRLVNYIENLIVELPESMQEKEHQSLDFVSTALAELRGLNTFVTEPKKESLCEDMEALINSDLDAQALMREIKIIQNRWKSLATSDSQADDILWDRFKKAADMAYEPCVVYLNELEVIKHNNLSARKQLCGEVKRDYQEFDWQHTNWKQVQSDYSNLWKKWNALEPIFFAENKPVQKEFDLLMNQLKEKLNNERNENHEILDDLISRAAVLTDDLQEESIDASIEQIKRLQTNWKSVGITHYNKAQKQWTKFRKQCDGVFDFQHTKHKQMMSQQDDQAKKAFAVIDNIKQLTALSDDQLLASQADFQLLKQQFSEFLDLPLNREEKIIARFKQVCEQYESTLTGLPHRLRKNSHSQIRKAANLCSDMERLALKQETKENVEPDQFDVLMSGFKLIESIGGSIKEALITRAEKAHQALKLSEHYAVDFLKENELELAQIAVELEVLFDLDSPKTARQQRMNYQLAQLQSGLRPALAKEQKHQQLMDLELSWYAVGAVPLDAREDLDARLARVIKQAET